MRLSSQLTSARFFAELVTAGVINDASAVDRVVIDAKRGGRHVVIHVQLVADADSMVKVIRDTPLLDGLDLEPGPGPQDPA